MTIRRPLPVYKFVECQDCFFGSGYAPEICERCERADEFEPKEPEDGGLDDLRDLGEILRPEE